MTVFVRLTKIRSDREENRYTESDDPSENVKTQEVTIQAASIRAITARKENRVGSRLTFNDGGGFAVTETKDIVESRLQEAGCVIVGRIEPAGFTE